MPAPEITRPPAPVQGIAVYVNRGQATWRAAVCVICLLILFGLLAPIFFLITFIMNSALGGTPLELPLLVLVAFVALLWLAAVIFVGRINWIMFAKLVFSQKPLLMINRAGITVEKMPAVSGFSITWSEIGAIFIRSTLYKYLCIAPKNPDLYLRRFNAVERLLRRSNALIGIPALIVPQIYLDKPVEEILQQLYYIYSSELSYYGVQLRP